MKVDINVASNFDDFVGFKLVEGIPTIFFPYAIEVNTNELELKRITLNLFKAIEYSIQHKNLVGELDYYKSNKNDSPILEYIWLISNYLENGLYFSNEKEFTKKPTGKINWKKTIQSQKLFAKKKQSLLEFTFEQNNYFEDLITEIQKYCLDEAYKVVGWFFGDLIIPNSKLKFDNINYFINILNKKLKNTYNDRKKQLIINLKKILAKSSRKSLVSDYVEFGTNNFHIIWQHIVDKLFGNTNIRKYYPYANYEILEAITNANSKMQPDTVMETEDIYLIDAKYYKFGITKNTNDLPGTSDIQKQIVYANFIVSKTLESKLNRKLYNSFVIPFNCIDFDKNTNKSKVAYVGRAYNDWQYNSTPKSKSINVILLDMNYALENYSKNRNKELISLFVKANVNIH